MGLLCLANCYFELGFAKIPDATVLQQQIKSRYSSNMGFCRATFSPDSSNSFIRI